MNFNVATRARAHAAYLPCAAAGLVEAPAKSVIFLTEAE
jgi:hypothetical protein